MLLKLFYMNLDKPKKDLFTDNNFKKLKSLLEAVKEEYYNVKNLLANE